MRSSATSNAERHATTTVTLELQENAEYSVLIVSDDGPGIPVQHHATVFEPFKRLDEARSREAGGSGLGLAIVHDIVTHHGGTMRDPRPPAAKAPGSSSPLPRID